MSKEELEQATIMEKLTRREITQKEGAKALRITERHVRRKLKAFKQTGSKSLAHKNRKRPSNKKCDSSKEGFAIDLLRSEWLGFGPTFASEKLFELHGIKMSRETLRKIMIKNELWKVHSRKIQHRIRRPRKVCFGMMIQLDGSPHDWFEGRAPKCTLLVFIDDATSKIVWLELVTSESVEDVMRATWNYFKVFGISRSFYTDYGSVFSVNTNNPERDKITQFERAMKELDVEVIHARSPQAKGRVERSNQTHQDRLCKELRLRNISSKEEANKFLQEIYIHEHNAKFAIQAADATDVHRSIRDINLSNILCIKEARTLQNDFTITYQKRIFQLQAQQKTIIRPKEIIIVNKHLDGSIRLSVRRVDLYFKEINERIKIEKQEKVREFKYNKPSENSRKSLSRFFEKKESRNQFSNRRVG